MRDRWLRDAFAAGLSSSSNSEQMNSDEYRMLTEKNLIDEDETIRLLSDYGISEEKLKVRLQVNLHVYLRGKYYINDFFFIKEIQAKKPEGDRGYFSTEELVDVFKKLSTRPEIYHLLVRLIQFT